MQRRLKGLAKGLIKGVMKGLVIGVIKVLITGLTKGHIQGQISKPVKTVIKGHAKAANAQYATILVSTMYYAWIYHRGGRSLTARALMPS